MYAEGSSISAIAKVMNVKLATVFSWVKKSPSGPGADGVSSADVGITSLKHLSRYAVYDASSHSHNRVKVISFDEMLSGSLSLV